MGCDSKTKGSRRAVAHPERCVEVLRRPRAQQATDRLAARKAWQDTGLVLTTALGPRMDAANVVPELPTAIAWCWPRPLGMEAPGTGGLVCLNALGRRQSPNLCVRTPAQPVIQTGAIVMDQLFSGNRRQQGLKQQMELAV
jgi:hypothetical protein